MTCAFCGRAAPESVPLEGMHAASCPGCLVRLGRTLVDAPLALAGVWPILARADEDDGEPEPKVRLPDGRSVDLKDHTAELKRDLRPDQRLELARTLGLLGMHREQIIECGHVLASEPPLPVARVTMALLLLRDRLPKDALAQIRVVLFPG